MRIRRHFLVLISFGKRLGLCKWIHSRSGLQRYILAWTSDIVSNVTCNIIDHLNIALRRRQPYIIRLLEQCSGSYHTTLEFMTMQASHLQLIGQYGANQVFNLPDWRWYNRTACSKYRSHTIKKEWPDEPGGIDNGDLLIILEWLRYLLALLEDLHERGLYGILGRCMHLLAASSSSVVSGGGAVYWDHPKEVTR